MDLARRYSNPNLETRRREELARALADRELQRRKRNVSSIGLMIQSRLRGAARSSPVADALFTEWSAGPLSRARRDRALRLLQTLDARSPGLLDDAPRVRGVLRLCDHEHRWVRSPEQWQPRSHNLARQFASLVRHLLARFDVPAFFDDAWINTGPHAATEREWFMHLGAGGNWRTAANLPFPLTKMAAHHAIRAPVELSPYAALRWGAALAEGCTPRQARAIVATRLGQVGVVRALEEPFWPTVFRFLAANPMLDPAQIGPMVDYLHHQKFEPGMEYLREGRLVRDPPPQPQLSMKARTVPGLMRQVTTWHRRLAVGQRGRIDVAALATMVWEASGERNYERVEGDGQNRRKFSIHELCSYRELVEEGRELHHCVASYAVSCRAGRVSIFSLRCVDREGLRRLLTIELNRSTRTVVQARGKRNARANQVELRLLTGWATQAGLRLSTYL